MSQVYWVGSVGSGRLGLMPRPEGGSKLAGEVRALKKEGVDRLVSLLPVEEARQLGLAEEASACAKADIVFESFPIEDFEVPDELESAIAFLRELIAHLNKGESVVIHCLGGIGRSGMMTAGVLVLTGIPPEEAIDRVSDARQLTSPDTREAREWVLKLGKIWKARHAF